MEQIRVLLANPYPIVRNGLRSLLERDSQIRVVGEAANGREAIVLAEYQHPTVAILDINLPPIRGIDAARTISTGAPTTRIIFVSLLADEGYIEEAFHAGANGYVYGNSVHSDLLRAVSVVAGGGVFLSPVIACALVDNWSRGRNPQKPTLTDREKHLFSLVAEGRAESEIAQLLMISEERVHSECQSVRSSLKSFDLSKFLFLSSPITPVANLEAP